MLCVVLFIGSIGVIDLSSLYLSPCDDARCHRVRDYEEIGQLVGEGPNRWVALGGHFWCLATRTV